MVYDDDLNPLPALEEPYVRAAMGEVRGSSVLDLGCGTGRHALWLAAAGATVTAVDFSAGMLRQAQKKQGAEAVRWVFHDLHTPLPFPAHAFERVATSKRFMRASTVLLASFGLALLACTSCEPTIRSKKSARTSK